MSFDDDLRLEPADGAYLVDIPQHWRIPRGVFGGYITAVLMRGMQLELGSTELPPRSLTVHFLRPARPGDGLIPVVTERRGSKSATVSASLVQDGQTVAMALGAFIGSRTGLEFNDLPMPGMIGPQALCNEPAPGFRPRFDLNFDRLLVQGVPYAGHAEAQSGGWIRLREPHPIDAPLVAMLTDAWFPATLARVSTQAFFLPTIDLTVHFRHPLPLEGSDISDFVYMEIASRVSADGFVEQDATIWSRDGRVLAQARQLQVFIQGPPPGGLEEPAS